MLTIFAAPAELERETILQRQREGIAIAKKQGKYKGRKYVSYKDIKALMADLKKVYTAATEEAAPDALDSFSAAWDSKYPKISKSWYENRPNLSTYFKFPKELRKLIYTDQYHRRLQPSAEEGD